MCETIPKLRDSIKEASMSDLKDFLESIRKHSGRIGEVAMKQVSMSYSISIVCELSGAYSSSSSSSSKNCIAGEHWKVNYKYQEISVILQVDDEVEINSKLNILLFFS